MVTLVTVDCVVIVGQLRKRPMMPRRRLRGPPLAQRRGSLVEACREECLVRSNAPLSRVVFIDLGGMPDMGDPDLQAAFSNPKVMAAMQDMMQNPANMMK